MGPDSAYLDSHKKQACCPSSARKRLCLLKGCNDWFRPAHVLARYCSSACQQAARRWSAWRANRRYRRTEHGRLRRREQALRRRERLAQANGQAHDSEPEPREGYPKQASGKNLSCHRPGCYECFVRPQRSPLKTYCSELCREALRRVRRREARWTNCRLE